MRSYAVAWYAGFQRKMTLQELREEGIRSIGNAVALMAEGESLTAHQRAMTIRLETLGS